MLNRIAFAFAIFVTIAIILALAMLAPHLTPTTVQAGGFAAPNLQSASEGGISVSGTGKVHIKPNVANAKIGVEVTAATLAGATSQANAKMAAIIDKLKGLGIADKDIQTISYRVSPITQQPKAGATPTISGYSVSNQLSVTIRKIEEVGKVLDGAVVAGANDIYGISFGVDDAVPYQQQARAAAVRDAQDKAAQLAKAANVTLGKVIALTESASLPYEAYRVEVALPAPGSGGPPIETGELEITIRVEMRFAVQ